jgi:DNA-directed DNA polymerase III PolC
MPALALTDRHGVYGAVRFYNACREHGIRPIFGAELFVDEAPLVLLARSSEGYAALNQLLSTAHCNDSDIPSLPLEQLAAHTHDLFCLTGGREGRLWKLTANKKTQQARRWLEQLHDCFGSSLFIELTHHFYPGDHNVVKRLYTLANDENYDVVATGDVRHATPEEYQRYDLLSCIRLGQTVFDDHPKRPLNDQAYLTSTRALERRIPYREAFENAAAIAQKCRVDLLPGEITPPAAEIPDGTSAGEYLHRQCRRALDEKYSPDQRPKASRQLQKELNTITDLDLEDYFLVVREVVEEAQKRGLRCAGRGSAANSLVTYLLEITNVDPLEHDLLFERFLHRGRKGTPDIDIDFDSERREEIITWMEERFGHEQTAMTATLVTYRLRSALRDTAKALGWPLETIDKLTSTVPRRNAGAVRQYRSNLEQVIGDSPLFDKLLTMVAGLHDCPRHLGLHNGGMVLSRTPLRESTPVQQSANGVTMVQFDKEDIEALGLVKLDVLGLRMFSSLSEATELIHRYQNSELDIDALPLDDIPTYNMMRASETIGVFQIESQGQLHLLAKHQPENFHDLITDIALFRPGPVQGNMVDPFINRRRGDEPITYDHPELEPILDDTYGIILFQEQILEIAHQFAGLSLREADDFRAAMSSTRDPELMEAMRDQFIGGATRRGIAREIAEKVFNQIAHFVGYGFCRSHAAAFAKTVYQSAYLKCHYPAAFMAALMQHRPGMYSQMTLEEEAKRLDVPILLPEIHRSGMRFDLEQTDQGWGIRKPLTIVTNVSETIARDIIWERMSEPFASVEDLYRRVAVPRNALEALARSGALDNLSDSSRSALWGIGVLANRLGPAGPSRAPKLFDMPAVDSQDIPDLSELSTEERLSWDLETHRAARTHPMALVRRQLTDLEIRPIETCYRISGKTLNTSHPPAPTITTAGLFILRHRPTTVTGVIFPTLEDEIGFIQCVVYPKFRGPLRHVLTRPSIIARGRLQVTGNWRGLVLTDAWVLNKVFGGYVGHPSASGGRDRWVRSSTSRTKGTGS